MVADDDVKCVAVHVSEGDRPRVSAAAGEVLIGKRHFRRRSTAGCRRGCRHGVQCPSPFTSQKAIARVDRPPRGGPDRQTRHFRRRSTAGWPLPVADDDVEVSVAVHVSEGDRVVSRLPPRRSDRQTRHFRRQSTAGWPLRVTDDDVQVSVAVHVSEGDRVRGSAAAGPIGKRAISVADQQLVGRSPVADDDVQVSVAVHVSEGDRAVDRPPPGRS